MNNDTNEPLGPIEYTSEVTESTGDHHYADTSSSVQTAPAEQTALSIFGLVLSFPFPILVVFLWISLGAIKGQGQAFGEGTMNAVVLYLLMFFVVPLLSITSLIIAAIVTIKSKEIAKKIGYISFGITALGFVVLGIFLNNS